MESVTITAAEEDLCGLIDRVNENRVPIAIANEREKGAVLISANDWTAINETFRLNSIPDMAASIEAGAAEPIGDCVRENNLAW